MSDPDEVVHRKNSTHPRWHSLIPRILGAIDKGISAVANLVVEIAYLGIVAVIGFNVFARATGLVTFAGAEELARLFLAWGALIYLGVSYKSGIFVRMQIVYERLSFPLREFVVTIERLLVIAFGALMLVSGLQWTILQYQLGRTSITSLGTPYWIKTAAIAVGGLAFMLAALTWSIRSDAREKLAFAPTGESA